MIYPWNMDLWRTLHRHSATPASTLLLAGPQGVGKRAFARALAQALLCGNPEPGAASCGSCMSCRLFAADAHPDFRLLEPASDEGRADAAEVQEGGSIRVGQVRAENATPLMG